MEPRPPHLFIVDDDAPTRDTLALYLRSQGYAVTTMASAEELMQRIGPQRPDLVVLDVVLPGATGLQACQRLRAARNRVPIMLLTALCDEVDRVIGLEVGADDFLGKPCSPRELLARIRALLRRAGDPSEPLPEGRDTVAIGSLTYHPAARLLAGDDGTLRVLSAHEHALLAEFVSHAGVALTREHLLAVSHGGPDALSPRTIDVAVMRLRRLVEPDPAEPRFIRTVRGLGYMFLPPRPQAPQPQPRLAATAHA